MRSLTKHVGTTSQMAKVTGPLHSSEARGGVGDLQFNTWRGLHTVRKRSGPTTLYSEDQLFLRAQAAQCTHRWKEISDAQRSAWNVFAASHPDPDWTGQPKRLSGFNWFIRINVRLLLIYWDQDPYHTPGWDGIRDDPPEDFDLPPLIIDSCYSNPGDSVVIDWIYQEGWDEKVCVEAYLAGPYSVGVNPTIKQADRKGSRIHGNFFFRFETAAAGRYTFFIRHINQHGITGGWLRAFVDHT